MKDESGRIMFDSLASAVEGLRMVLKYARTCEETFTFGPLTAQQILASGLHLSGSTNKIRAMLDDVPGASWYAD
jgi:hypothetical protein